MKQLAEPFMGFLLLFLVFLVSRYGTEQVLSEQALAGLKQPKQPVVVVDAGHGGNDPGKVAVNGSLEKDINLAIAKRLAWYLEQADVTVCGLVFDFEDPQIPKREEISNFRKEVYNRRELENLFPTLINDGYFFGRTLQPAGPCGEKYPRLHSRRRNDSAAQPDQGKNGYCRVLAG